MLQPCSLSAENVKSWCTNHRMLMLQSGQIVWSCGNKWTLDSNFHSTKVIHGTERAKQDLFIPSFIYTNLPHTCKTGKHVKELMHYYYITSQQRSVFSHDIWWFTGAKVSPGSICGCVLVTDATGGHSLELTFALNRSMQHNMLTSILLIMLCAHFLCLQSNIIFCNQYLLHCQTDKYYIW
jgi:hypothetical protein